MPQAPAIFAIASKPRTDTLSSVLKNVEWQVIAMEEMSRICNMRRMVEPLTVSANPYQDPKVHFSGTITTSIQCRRLA